MTIMQSRSTFVGSAAVVTKNTTEILDPAEMPTENKLNQFHQGHPARRWGRQMDSKVQIQIERNIPIPGKAGRNGLSKYPWSEMAVGDSFLFPPGMSGAAASSNAASAQKRTGSKFSVRVTDNGYRCWRTA
jgi:hypothetical protein